MLFTCSNCEILTFPSHQHKLCIQQWTNRWYQMDYFPGFAVDRNFYEKAFNCQNFLIPFPDVPITDTLNIEPTEEVDIATTEIPTTSISLSNCEPPFQVSGAGCYLASHTPLSWYSAENYCQSFGPNVHLAGMETNQVRMIILTSNQKSKWPLRKNEATWRCCEPTCQYDKP